MLPTKPYLGYRWDRIDQDGRKQSDSDLIVNEDEADVVRLIFDLYEKVSQRQVALRLNEQGYRLPVKSPANRKIVGSNQRLFRPNDINRIIRLKLYAGLLT